MLNPIKKKKAPAKIEYKWGECKCWEDRSRLIGNLIPSHTSVIDIGGGFEHLKKFLKEATIYKAIDIKPCTKQTIVADFNKNEYPKVGNFNYVVCQGVIEYIKNVDNFLNKMKQYGDIMIITYRLGRVFYHRVNDMIFYKFERHLMINDWEILFERQVDPKMKNEKIYYCINKKYGKKR